MEIRGLSSFAGRSLDRSEVRTRTTGCRDEDLCGVCGRDGDITKLTCDDLRDSWIASSSTGPSLAWARLGFDFD